MKNVRLLLILSLLLLFLITLTHSAYAEDRQVFKVGVVLPLSGESAQLGTYMRNALQLAHSELNDAGDVKIELIFEDDGWEAHRSVSAFQKLVTSGGVDALIVLGSAAGNALAPLAERRKIPLIAVGASDAKIAAGRNYSFIHWVTPEIEAKVLAEEIQRRNYQRLGIIATEHEGVIAVISAVEDQLKSYDMSDLVLINQNFLPGDSDFRTYLARARSLELDGIIVCLLPGSLSSFARLSRQLGLEVDLIGIELFEDENEVQASDGALVGHWYVNADIASSDFQKSYRERFGHHPGWATANAYDSLHLLAAGFRQYGKEGNALAQFLRELSDYEGAAGRYSSTGDGRFTLPAAVKVVTAEGFEKVQRE